MHKSKFLIFFLLPEVGSFLRLPFQHPSLCGSSSLLNTHEGSIHSSRFPFLVARKL